MQQDRLDPTTVAPGLLEALFAVEREIRSHLDSRLFHLVKLRASMTNGCAFCVDMHATDALAEGESLPRLFGLAAWRETPLYTDAERAAFELTDAVTRLGEHGVPDDVWAAARAHFDDVALLHLVAGIGQINLWNRLSITLRRTPASARVAAA